MKSLQHELLPLLLADFPQIEEREPTFFDVAGISYRETAICQVYAHFLDYEKSPLIAPLMLTALLELVEDRSGKKIELDYPVIELEVSTKNNKRIDILISEESPKKALIIEVKIFHSLNNDLQEYWEHLQTENKSKVGVIMGIRNYDQTEINNPNFISISHMDLFNKTLESGLPVGLTNKQWSLFNDFYQNMTMMSETNPAKEELDFYRQYHRQIELAVKTKEKALAFVLDILNKVALGMDGWELYGRSNEWRNLWDKKNSDHLFYTFYPGEILKKPTRVRIVIESGRNHRKQADELRNQCEELCKDLDTEPGTNQSSHFAHLISVFIQLDENNPDSWHEHISDFISTKLEGIRNQLKDSIQEQN